nr:MAG TPA: hypothetical protein [Caudoviricetes sp.]
MDAMASFQSPILTAIMAKPLRIGPIRTAELRITEKDVTMKPLQM